MSYLARFDPLTGLINRFMFSDRLQNAIARARRDGGLVSLMFLDLDEFKVEPDRYGDMELPDWLTKDEEAWLIVPLSTREELLGIILVDRGVIGIKLNYEDRDLLKTVGSHIAVHLAQEQSDSLLTEARQFEAYNRLTAFLRFRVKSGGGPIPGVDCSRPMPKSKTFAKCVAARHNECNQSRCGAIHHDPCSLDKECARRNAG